MANECSICLSEYKEPLAVPCGHVFCTPCLQAHVNASNSATASTCPQCRKDFPIVVPDLTYLPTKYHQYVQPSVRRLYIDSPQRPSLQQKLSDLKERNRKLEQDQETLLQQCEQHMAAAQAHAQGEKKARSKAKKLDNELQLERAKSQKIENDLFAHQTSTMIEKTKRTKLESELQAEREAVMAERTEKQRLTKELSVALHNEKAMRAKCDRLEKAFKALQIRLEEERSRRTEPNGSPTSNGARNDAFDAAALPSDDDDLPLPGDDTFFTPSQTPSQTLKRKIKPLPRTRTSKRSERLSAPLTLPSEAELCMDVKRPRYNTVGGK